MWPRCDPPPSKPTDGLTKDQRAERHTAIDYFFDNLNDDVLATLKIPLRLTLQDAKDIVEKLTKDHPVTNTNTPATTWARALQPTTDAANKILKALGLKD